MSRLGFCFPRGSEDGLYGVDESGTEMKGRDFKIEIRVPSRSGCVTSETREDHWILCGLGDAPCCWNPDSGLPELSMATVILALIS